LRPVNQKRFVLQVESSEVHHHQVAHFSLNLILHSLHVSLAQFIEVLKRFSIKDLQRLGQNPFLHDWINLVSFHLLIVHMVDKLFGQIFEKLVVLVIELFVEVSFEVIKGLQELILNQHSKIFGLTVKLSLKFGD